MLAVLYPLLFFRRRQKNKKPRAPIAIAPTVTPTPIPAWAPVESPDEPVDVGADDADVDALDVVRSVEDEDTGVEVIDDEVIVELELEVEPVAVLTDDVNTAFAGGTVASTVADGTLKSAAEAEQQLRFPGSLGVRSQQ